ncbi:MAG: site-2 protease family protein [Oscillospiraceae bacterium]|nr:site-2 protease family protein [Oscillospiraceae bacterium]
MDTLQTIWRGLDWSVPVELLLRVLPALLCITLHEMAHGYAALLMGDTTAKDRGRLSLNPLHHIDWMGLVMMVAFRFGWAKPVPINMYRFKNPKRGMALTALAGPVCNFLLACLMLLLFGVSAALSGSSGGLLPRLLVTTAYLSLSLGIFNLLPVPPLDGSKVLFSLLSDNAYEKLMRYERYGMLLLVALLSTGVLSNPLSAAVSRVFDALIVLAERSFALTVRIFR